MPLLTFLHKGHACGVLVSIYMCTDCEHVEIIQTKSLTRLTDGRLVLSLFKLFYICPIIDNFKICILSFRVYLIL